MSSSRKAKTLATLLAVIMVASMIFFFSAQDSKASSRTSNAIVKWLLPRIIPGYTEMTRKQQKPYIRQWRRIVRKTAHFLEYTLLALTVVFYLRYMMEGKKPWVIALSAWLAATLYACTDELHQMFVKGRGPSPIDVLIDSGGGLTGTLIGILIMMLWFRHKKKKREALA